MELNEAEQQQNEGTTSGCLPEHMPGPRARPRDSGGRRSPPPVAEWQAEPGQDADGSGGGLRHMEGLGPGRLSHVNAGMEGDFRVRQWSEDEEESQASSGAKAFPSVDIVAGNRATTDEGTSSPLPAGAPAVEMVEESVAQQMLMDTQLDGGGEGMDVNGGGEGMDVNDGGDGGVATGSHGVDSGAEVVAGGSSTTEREQSEGAAYGSYGAGRVQSDLSGWLK